MNGALLPFPDRSGDGHGQVVINGRNQLKKAYQPSTKTREEWKREGQRRSDSGYTQRWMAFWGRTVRAVALLGNVGTTELHWIDEYVRRTRLSELHRHEAEKEPYQVYPDSGYVAAHPGFAQSRSEAKAARELAADLGLTPSKRRAAGIEVPRPDTAATQGYLDDQTGPDGEPL